METKDIVKPAGLLVGFATLAVGTLALGYLVTRDRETLRRVARVAAGTVERVSSALAETREELTDMWAQARDEARQELDDEAFAAATSADGKAPVDAMDEAAEVSQAPSAANPVR